MTQALTTRCFPAAILCVAAGHGLADQAEYPDALYWGDTHVHTSYSVDAFFLGNRTVDPDTAYRFARGQPVIHPATRARVRIDRPLDFLVVADHAEQLGVGLRLAAGDPDVAGTATGKQYIELLKQGRGREVFRRIVQAGNSGKGTPELHNEAVRRHGWHDITAAADRHNDPGRFTAFIGWEWSSTVDGANLHRVVFTPQDASVANRFLPFSALESNRPEDLWEWLAATSRETGAEFVAIPHNSNLSKGRMFAATDSDGRPLGAAWARTRAAWEPVVEITQTKGDSETHPVLSPNDEFASFEYFPSLIDMRPGSDATPTTTDGDYVRGALKRGLALQQSLGTNPYKFGVIGSTDVHSGLSTADEAGFPGVGGTDSTPEQKGPLGLRGATGWSVSSSGLAAVWAHENTRQSIADAFRRREVYATTGPRIQVRFFGGWRFARRDADRADIAATGYRKGVPMGSDLPPRPGDCAPAFLIHVSKDPAGANLDRVQVVKGWVDADGRAHERVHDAVWSRPRRLDAAGVPADVGNTVDPATASHTNTIGAESLATVWTDPDFEADAAAFYYLRVLEIPTPRHSLLDAVALGIDPATTGQAATLQERAYSSPIWYAAAGREQ